MDSKDIAQKCKDPKQSLIQELFYNVGARWIQLFGEELAALTEKEDNSSCQEVFMWNLDTLGGVAMGVFPGFFRDSW